MNISVGILFCIHEIPRCTVRPSSSKLFGHGPRWEADGHVPNNFRKEVEALLPIWLPLRLFAAGVPHAGEACGRLPGCPTTRGRETCTPSVHRELPPAILLALMRPCYVFAQIDRSIPIQRKRNGLRCPSRPSQAICQGLAWQPIFP